MEHDSTRSVKTQRKTQSCEPKDCHCYLLRST